MSEAEMERIDLGQTDCSEDMLGVNHIFASNASVIIIAACLHKSLDSKSGFTFGLQAFCRII